VLVTVGFQAEGGAAVSGVHHHGAVARRSGLPARDLRVLGPLLSRSPSILGELLL
jgi:hypothetical protein